MSPTVYHWPVSWKLTILMQGYKSGKSMSFSLIIYVCSLFGGDWTKWNYEIPVDLPSQNFSIRRMVLFDVLLASDFFYNH
jgi:hypothetical protein